MGVRVTAGLLMLLVGVITACGSLASAPPARQAPQVVSARFGSGPEGPPMTPTSVAKGTPIAVTSVTADIGFVLERASNESGVGGALLRTVDGGANWATLPLPPRLVYQGLYAHSADNVVVWAETPGCVDVGHTCTAEVLSSSDGGLHFTVTEKANGLAWTAARAYAPAGLWLAASSANCFGSCHPVSALYTSTTAGATWTKAASGANVPALVAVWTKDGTSGYGLTAQGLYHSADDGRNWTLLSNLPTPAGGGAFAAFLGTIAVPSPGVLDISACNAAALAGGGCPVSVFQSTNGGHTLRNVLNWSRNQEGLLHMVSSEQGTVIMTGMTGANIAPGHPRTNIAVATQNGFATATVSSRLPLYADAVAFRSPQDGWAVGTPQGCFPGPPSTCPLALATTANGGRSWSLVGTPPVPTQAVQHPAAHVWWGLGTGSSASALSTSTNGTTWRVVGAIPGTSSGGGCGTTTISFPSANTGYVVDGAALYRTVDGGRNWALLGASPTKIDNIWFSSASQGIALAGHCAQPSARLYATQDGGEHWTPVGRLPSGAIAVVFQSPTVGWATVAVAGHKEVRLLETTDGGALWRPVPLHLPVSSSGLVSLPGGTLVVETSGSWLIVQAGRLTATVKMLGSTTRGVPFAGILPIRTAERLELFILGQGLWSSPWQRNMVLQASGG